MNTRKQDLVQICVYCCSRLADTNDHAPPRCLLRLPLGNDANIITLPSCRQCNTSFSGDENIVKTVLAHVSDEPELMEQIQPGKAVHRAMERDRALKELVEQALQADGMFRLSPKILSAFYRVVCKTVQGLYFGTYGQHLAEDLVTVLSVDHVLQVPIIEVLRSLRRSATPDLSRGLWPEVRGEPRRLAKVARFLPNRLTEHDLMSPVEWIDIQPNAFRFAFIRMEAQQAACVLDIRHTLVAAAECPWPGERGPLRKGRRQKYSRQPRSKS